VQRVHDALLEQLQVNAATLLVLCKPTIATCGRRTCCLAK
jgi:hypothetical protein